MPLSVGIKAPEFELSDETSQLRKLSDFQGMPIVLYFYPKDDTPGCSTEACNFRDDYAKYQQAGVQVLGVSPDSPTRHTKFILKYQLPFPLLADVDHKVCERYGVWGRKKFMGREYDGVSRTTFLIGLSGMIVRVFENVSPSNHSQEVLGELGKLKTAPELT